MTARYSERSAADIEADMRQEQRIGRRLQVLEAANTKLERGALQFEARVSALEANAVLLQAAKSFMLLEGADKKLAEHVLELTINCAELFRKQANGAKRYVGLEQVNATLETEANGMKLRIMALEAQVGNLMGLPEGYEWKLDKTEGGKRWAH